MSKLLHSKTFRNNLIKWIMIYVCVMLSTVSVITYSKYISELQSNASSTPAKFILTVTDGDICSATIPTLCNIEKFKTNDSIDYNFTVDTLELEVNTLLVLTINVNSSFNIDSLYVDDEEINLESTEGYSHTNNVITITENVSINNTSIKNYKVRLSLKDSATNYSITNALVVNYSATQVD